MSLADDELRESAAWRVPSARWFLAHVMPSWPWECYEPGAKPDSFCVEWVYDGLLVTVYAHPTYKGYSAEVFLNAEEFKPGAGWHRDTESDRRYRLSKNRIASRDVFMKKAPTPGDLEVVWFSAPYFAADAKLPKTIENITFELRQNTLVWKPTKI